ncbi:hypothetical protein GCM10010191_04920 [Actinomadura vinacea]|uniref:50S ribosomal protein L28 n=1 Tax=Actinomadura vinacea TaxID=115336 RepID=A0ABN3IE47_9ACTN
MPADRRQAGLRQEGVALPQAHPAPVRPQHPDKRYWLPGEGRYVRLRLSAHAIKTIDKIGIEAAVARVRARGEKV